MPRAGLGQVLRRLAIGLAVSALIAFGPGDGGAQEDVKQAAVEPSGKAALPVPRFVSLKSDKVNVRRGPSTDQAIVWVFSRAGLPVEVISESDNWRRVRDSAAVAYGATTEHVRAGQQQAAKDVNHTAWEKELAFILKRARTVRGSTVRFNREDSYDKRRMRLPD